MLQQARLVADIGAVHALGSVYNVLLEWLTTGRFPREEFRIDPLLLVLFVLIVGPVIVLLILKAFE